MTPTAQHLVERSLRAWAPRTAVVDGSRAVTYAQLGERSARLANVLLAAGAGPDRPGAILLPNRLEYLEADVACTRAGVTRLGISERLGPDECVHALADSGSRVLIATPALFEPIADALPDTLGLVLLIDGPAPGRAGGVRVADYERTLAEASPRLLAPRAAPDDPNYILYTSGTTGRPKGATHTHGGRVAAMLNMLACELRIDSDSAMVHAAPLSHGSGSKAIAFLAAGARNVVLPRFTPEGFGEAVARGGTHTFMVPTMLQRLLEAGPDVVRSVARLDGLSFGGAPISPGLFRRSIEAFGPILTQVYGSSEAPHPITLLGPDDYRGERTTDALLTTAGRAAAGVEIRVVDDAGADAGPDAVGELLIRAPHVMRSYWGNEQATHDVLSPDGWYRAGDLVTVGDDGLVTFRDRKRDLVITGGLNVYPSEVERVIAEHPQVRQVAVVGAPDDEWGEAVVAYVVPVNGELSPEDVIAWARDRLAGYKKPRRVVLRESLPVGASNKIVKTELREMLWQGRERRVN